MNGFRGSRWAILAIVLPVTLLAAGTAAVAHTHSEPGDQNSCSLCIASQFGWPAVVETLQTCPVPVIASALPDPLTVPLRAVISFFLPARAPPVVL